MDNSFHILKYKLEVFIKRYYKNLIIKGFVVVPLLTFGLIFCVSLLEYFGWFTINLRLFIFLLTTFSTIFFCTYFLLIPILKYFGIGKTLTNRHAALILTRYFPELKDYIVNILELNDLKDNDLITSSINQKIYKIKDYDFNRSINFHDNFKFGRFFLIAFGVFLVTILWKPEIYTQGTKRIVNYSTVYEKDPGFIISIDSSLLNIKRGDDLIIDFQVEGDILPDQLFINYGNSNFLLEKNSPNSFSYTFRNVNNNFSFKINNDFYSSKVYNVIVNNIPVLKNYSVQIKNPIYLDKNDDVFENLNEISVPRGSIMNFEFLTAYCNDILVQKNDTFLLDNKNGNLFNYSLLASDDISFSISLVNDFTDINSVITINVHVIPDLYPSIRVSYVKDESNFRLFYFKGEIEDDYGFTKLVFNSALNSEFFILPISLNSNNQEFYYAYEFPLNQDYQEIYFTVYDNDKLNGFKSTKSEIVSIDIPSVEEISKIDEESFSKLNDKLDKSLLMAFELERDIEEIKKSLINDKLEVWEKQSKLKALENKHKKLEKIIKEIAKENLQKDSFKNSFSENEKELMEKQKQIQELLENVLSDELKKLMEEVNKLANDFDENALQELTKDLELNYDELSKQLDRNLELLKRFELEERISNTISELKELSKEQKLLSEELKNKKANVEQISKDLKNNIKQLETVKEEYKDILEKNEDLSKGMNLNDFEDEFQKIDSSLNETSESIEEDKKQEENSEQLNESSEKLKDLADSMKSMLDSNSEEQAGEDAETLRQILENLFVFSFKQEELYTDIKNTSQDNPRFAELKQVQKNLSDDYSIIRDSLYALGARSSHIGSHITSSAFSIETELLKVVEELKGNRISVVSRRQRDLLTNTNDMILLLSESLKNMDNSMGSGGKSGKQKKKKPKKGDEPSLSEMQKGQESLKQQLENMLNQMKGEKGKGSKQGLEQLGKSLAQQEIMQQMLNEMLNNGSVGKEASKKLEEIKRMMEANKRDLVNMNISTTTINRQQQILTRLLEAETAEMERDKDDKRESNEAYRYKMSNPEKMFDDYNENVNFNEIFNTKSLNLFDFYKYKYQEYLMKINNFSNEEGN